MVSKSRAPHCHVNIRVYLTRYFEVPIIARNMKNKKRGLGTVREGIRSSARSITTEL